MKRNSKSIFFDGFSTIELLVSLGVFSTVVYIFSSNIGELEKFGKKQVEAFQGEQIAFELKNNLKSSDRCDALVKEIEIGNSRVAYKDSLIDVFMEKVGTEDLYSLSFHFKGNILFESYLELRKDPSNKFVCVNNFLDKKADEGSESFNLSCGQEELVGFENTSSGIKALCGSSEESEDEFVFGETTYCRGNIELLSRNKNSCDSSCEVLEKIKCTGNSNRKCPNSSEIACVHQGELVKDSEEITVTRKDICRNGDGQCLPFPKSLNYCSETPRFNTRSWIRCSYMSIEQCNLKRAAYSWSRVKRVNWVPDDQIEYNYNTLSYEENQRKPSYDRASHTCPSNIGCEKSIGSEIGNNIYNRNSVSKGFQKKSNLCTSLRYVNCQAPSGSWACRVNPVSWLESNANDDPKFYIADFNQYLVGNHHKNPEMSWEDAFYGYFLSKGEPQTKDNIEIFIKKMLGGSEKYSDLLVFLTEGGKYELSSVKLKDNFTQFFELLQRFTINKEVCGKRLGECYE